MKREIQEAIDGLRFLAVLLETGELSEYEQQFRINAIASDLEAIADRMLEADE